MQRRGWGVGGGLPFKQTAVSHGYIVSIAPCLDDWPSSSSSHLQRSSPQIACGRAAESKLKLSKRQAELTDALMMKRSSTDRVLVHGRASIATSDPASYTTAGW